MKIMAVMAAAILVSVLAACGAGMGGMGGMSGCGGGGGHAGHGGGDMATHEGHTMQAAEATAPAGPDPNFDSGKMLASLDAYDRIVVALAADHTGGVVEAAGVLASQGPNADIRYAASELSLAGKSGKLTDVRTQFKKLSTPMVAYAERNRVAMEAALKDENRAVPKKAYCPMANAAWLQNEEKITNPFYGSSMLRCGEFKELAAGQTHRH